MNIWISEVISVHKLLHEYQDNILEINEQDHDRVQMLISLIHFSSTTDVKKAIDEADVVALINVVKSISNINLNYFIWHTLTN